MLELHSPTLLPAPTPSPLSCSRFLLPFLTLALAFSLSACASILSPSSPSGALTTRNLNTSAQLSPTIASAAYRYSDENTADIYLSDIPLDRLVSESDPLLGVTGSLIHIHLFLVPSAGDTPIDPTACNVSFRQLILAPPTPDSPPHVGLYVGGGFLYPHRDPGADALSASIFDASLRCIAASPGFSDPLSPAQLTGSFSAPLDDSAANALALRIERLIRSLQPTNLHSVSTQPRQRNHSGESSQSTESNQSSDSSLTSLTSHPHPHSHALFDSTAK